MPPVPITATRIQASPAAGLGAPILTSSIARAPATKELPYSHPILGSCLKIKDVEKWYSSQKNAMARARRTRLARMAAQSGLSDSAEAAERASLRARAAVCTFVREQLAQAGIDPEQVGALGPAPPMNAVLAEEEREGFVLSDGDSLASLFADKIGQLARRYEDRSEPDFANASLAELFAWCISRGN